MRKMKRSILILLTTLLFSYSLVGCGSNDVVVNVENEGNIHNAVFGESELIFIGNGLYYDSTTRIVYLKMNSVGGFSYMTAYYAPNGLPYRYNPETNTFEEI